MGSGRMLGRSAKDNDKPSAQIYRDDPSQDDALSLHSNIGESSRSLFTDTETEIEDDLPPYSDEQIEANPNDQAQVEVYEETPPGFAIAASTEVERFESNDKKGSRQYVLSNKHTSDPAALEYAIRSQLRQPPAAFVRISGEHTEKRYDSNKKKTESHTVQDFDIKLDISNLHSPWGTPRLSDGSANPGLPAEDNKSWTYLSVVDNATKTYRGGIMKSINKLGKIAPDVEVGDLEGPNLRTWTHLFCASHYSLKSFELRHEISGRGDETLQKYIEQYVRATNYRGRLSIVFELAPRTLTFQTRHKLNRARHNRWIWWACVLLQLWIITWPILYFTTKRWAVVKVVWPVARCCGRWPKDHPDYETTQPRMYRYMSEKKFVARWRYSIQQAVLQKCIMGHVVRWNGEGEEEARATAERTAQADRNRANEVQCGFVGGVLGIARGLSNIARENNDSRGWGYDE